MGSDKGSLSPKPDHCCEYGDYFRHLGLTFCPDVDTVMYTLAGIQNPDTGWGIDGYSLVAMERLSRYGGSTWFRLGDCDLGTHLAGTEMMEKGLTLTEVTTHLCRCLIIRERLLSMTDQSAPTLVDTEDGRLPFREWFVHCQWQPVVQDVALPQPQPVASQEVLIALETADLVVIAPSNPMVSVAPVLNVDPVWEIPQSRRMPVVGVSPIIGEQTVKGPAAKMMADLGLEVSPVGIAQFYSARLLSGFVLDQVDASSVATIEAMGIVAFSTDTWMRTESDRIGLAQRVLEWVGSMSPGLAGRGVQ